MKPSDDLATLVEEELLPLLRPEERPLDAPGLPASAPHLGAQLLHAREAPRVRERLQHHPGELHLGQRELHAQLVGLHEAFEGVRARVVEGDLVEVVRALARVRVELRELLAEAWFSIARLGIEEALARRELNAERATGRFLRASLAARPEAHELLAAVEAAARAALPPEPEWTREQWDLVLALRDARRVLG